MRLDTPPNRGRPPQCVAPNWGDTPAQSGDGIGYPSSEVGEMPPPQIASSGAVST